MRQKRRIGFQSDFNHYQIKIMAAIDIILILIFALSAWLGFRKGIITQLGSVAAIVIAIIACRVLGSQISDMILASHPDWAAESIKRYGVSILANCGIYIVVYYGVVIIARLLRSVTHAVLLGPLDRIAGAAFSVAKYFLLVSILLNLYIVLFPSTTLLSRSRLAGGQAVDLVVGFAPWMLDTMSPVESDTRTTPEPAPVKGTASQEPVSPL